MSIFLPAAVWFLVKSQWACSESRGSFSMTTAEPFLQWPRSWNAETLCVKLLLNSFLPAPVILNNPHSQRSIKHLCFQNNVRIPEARSLLAISEKSSSTTPSSGNLGSWMETRANDDWKEWKAWKKLRCTAMWEHQHTQVQLQLMYLWPVSTMWLFSPLAIQNYSWVRLPIA